MNPLHTTRFCTLAIAHIIITMNLISCAVAYKHMLSTNTLNTNSVNSFDAIIPTVLNYTTDKPFDFVLYNTDAPVLTRDPVTIYYIFYGNFSNLEMWRITNYSKHITDPSTKPNWWSIATKYYDGQGNFVDKHVKFGGSVHDTDYSYGYNLSTTQAAYKKKINVPIEETDVAKIILGHVGNGKMFPYSSMAIYSLITSPDVHFQDCPNDCYSGNHLSMKVVIDGEERSVNHAFIPSITGSFFVASDLDTAPNGDTGRYVVDSVIQTMHHEIFEGFSDEPVSKTPDFFILRNLRFTKSSLNATGRYYNTIINNQIYALQDIWGFDDQGIQSCYSSTTHTRDNEFKALSVAVNPVTAADGIKNYAGPINVPCKGFYISKSYGGYHTLSGEDVCHFVYQGPSLLNIIEGNGIVFINATFDLPESYQILSHNHAHYEWRLASEVNEANAVMTFDDDVNPPTVTDDGKVLVVYQDDWRLVPDENGITRQVDFGVSYWCRALVNGVWYVGATKFKGSCEMNIDGVYKSVPKTDSSVSLLVKPAPK
ncbi:hypothetical protein HDU76_003843 [Blyttiomyces sp. JEL0837]|nr:hypothetical protein HDU76_003843 [Blyttiomyces sp. JEL0837]